MLPLRKASNCLQPFAERHSAVVAVIRDQKKRTADSTMSLFRDGSLLLLLLLFAQSVSSTSLQSSLEHTEKRLKFKLSYVARLRNLLPLVRMRI